MIRSLINRSLQGHLQALIQADQLPDAAYPPIQCEAPKQPDHGDLAVPFALGAARFAGMNPRALAELLVERLRQDPLIASVEIAGPGFVNLRLSPTAYQQALNAVLNSAGHSVLRDAAHFGRPSCERPERINVEFVSVNPNGPITIGSGRGAAYGSALCNVLQAAGHTVHREYYINDGVNSEQMRQFALSVRALKLGTEFPEKGYKGDYVQAVADQIEPQGDPDVIWWQQEAQALMLQRQRRDLETFGVAFDTWFSEQTLHDSGRVQACIDELEAKGIADRQPVRRSLKLGKKGVIEDVIVEDQPVDEDDAAGSEPTVWLRSTKLGDDKDRVLRRKDGRLTYIAGDVAYHDDKFNRPPNTDRLITVLGPDHHGFIGRLNAVVAAMQMPPVAASAEGEPLSEIDAKRYVSPAERDACQAAAKDAESKLLVQIYQLVRFMKDGQPAPMRKRDGNIYAISDLIEEIGAQAAPQADREEQVRIGRDVARFFYLMRHHDTTFDFDLDLAARQSDENPVFYVQYAHARIEQVLRRAREEASSLYPDSNAVNGGLTAAARDLHEREKQLLLQVCALPDEVALAAEDGAVNRLTNYAMELARAYHGFYDTCRVIDTDAPEVSQQRLALCVAARTALQGVLELLGVSAPLRMDRPAAPSE
ncbi:MAG: arginine--tRNA ligase [Fimbriimonadaceae bacterium]|nr:arginine--tRNA ligase [Fimbriimonadaceae bacterium]